MKMRAILWLMLGAVLILAGCTTKDATGPNVIIGSGTRLIGELTTNLTIGESPYWVQGDVTIPEGASVRIDPGVEIRFDANNLYAFYVKGHLEAVGDSGNNIVFTSMDGALGGGDFGQWRSILFDTKDDVSRLEYCVIKFGASSDTNARYTSYPDSVDPVGLLMTGAVIVWNCSPVINHCTIVKNGYHGIYCVGADAHPVITNNNIYENDGDGIRCAKDNIQIPKATPDIRNNNSKENNGQNWAELPLGIGELVTVNVNRDSCDFQNNISLNPDFGDFEHQDYSLNACSHCIGAASDGLAMGAVPYHVAANELRGPIGNRTINGGSYIVTCDAFVETDSSFILSNTTLEFEGLYSLTVAGLFQVDNVTFLPDTTLPDAKWNGIMILSDANENSFIRNSRFINASTTEKSDPYGGAITIKSISPTLYNNTFTNCLYTAISLQNGSEPEISYNTIDGFGTAGIYCYNNCDPYIHHNIIKNGSGYGIWCKFLSSPHIESNVIYNTSLIGIQCETQAQPFIEYNTLVNHDYTGIDCRFNSSPIIQNNIIAFNGASNTYNLTDYGNGINVLQSSFPAVTFNDVYQAPDQGNAFSSGMTPDTTNHSVDPMFDMANARPYFLLPDSPCLHYSSTPVPGQIGAYGKGIWP